MNSFFYERVCFQTIYSAKARQLALAWETTPTGSLLLTPSGDRGGIHGFLFCSFKLDDSVFPVRAFSGSPRAAGCGLGNRPCSSYSSEGSCGQ